MISSDYHAVQYTNSVHKFTTPPPPPPSEDSIKIEIETNQG
jgi:hypothetical protein